MIRTRLLLPIFVSYWVIMAYFDASVCLSEHDCPSVLLRMRELGCGFDLFSVGSPSGEESHSAGRRFKEFVQNKGLDKRFFTCRTILVCDPDCVRG